MKVFNEETMDKEKASACIVMLDKSEVAALMRAIETVSAARLDKKQFPARDRKTLEALHGMLNERACLF